MRFYKMAEVLNYLSSNEVSKHGQIYTTYGGELCFEFVEQPPEHVHKFLMEKGFVRVEDTYVYRPRIN